ncbi:MAG: hypothetical protein AAB091_02305 [Elusimicrobiota bacterium]
MIRMLFAALGLVILEVLYSLVGARMVYYFVPLLALQASALVGLLLGPAKASWWGALTGFLEDVYFISSNGAIGLSSIVYLWVGWVAGKLFYERADADNPAMGAVATAFALALGLVLAKILSLVFNVALPAFSSMLTWTRVFSLAAQIALGPWMLRLMAWILQPRNSSRHEAFQ